MQLQRSDVVVIGAGPSGSISSAMLHKRGYSVRVIERQKFPRFSIGESLLPHSMDFIEAAGMLGAVHSAGFQYKNGAAFIRDGKTTDFNFADKFGHGYSYTFQVQRGPFDHVLSTEAARQGVDVRYEEEVLEVDFSRENPRLVIKPLNGERYDIETRFVLDASGFGRTLPKMLKLEKPSHFPVRQAYFTHLEDRVVSGTFDRQKILITTHPKHHDIWFWTIPFSNGRSSMGVVGAQTLFADQPEGHEGRLKKLISEDPALSKLLANAVFDTPVNELKGYAANVERMYGNGFALLGNAAEFLDPVFSSGVTIAMKSATMAADLLARQLGGQSVSWEDEYEKPLRRGINAFKTYVTRWYDGQFQTVIFHPKQDPKLKAMICAVLAGYAWNWDNPFVAESDRRLSSLYELCK